jgi:hypothetical protein
MVDNRAGCASRLRPAHRARGRHVAASLAVLVGLWASAACGAGMGASTPGAGPAAAPPAVQSTTTTDTSTAPPYTATLTLPVLAWPGHDAVAVSVNAQVQSWAKSQESAFGAQVAADLKNAVGLPASLPQSSMTITYKVALRTSHAVSYQFLIEPYERGAAHPSQNPAGLTFDLATGRAVALSDLFQPGAGYLSTLAAQARTGLAAFTPAGAHCYLGQAPSADAGSFQAWWLSSAGLVLSFPAGTYTASYCGPPTVTIPYAALSGAAARGSLLLQAA